MFFTFTVVAWVRYLVGKPSHMLSRAAKIPKKKKKREREFLGNLTKIHLVCMLIASVLFNFLRPYGL